MRTVWAGGKGQGGATRALKLFLEGETDRPVYARVAKNNPGSVRVLEKYRCTVAGQNKGFAPGRGEEVAEWVMVIGEKQG